MRLKKSNDSSFSPPLSDLIAPPPLDRPTIGSLTTRLKNLRTLVKRGVGVGLGLLDPLFAATDLRSALTTVVLRLLLVQPEDLDGGEALDPVLTTQ